MIREQADQPFDEDYYVIDEPPAPQPMAERDRFDDRAVREQLAEAIPTARRFEAYWVVPDDIDWAED